MSAVLNDDWTPAKLASHREWRSKMFAPVKPPPKRDPLVAKIEAISDPQRAAMECRMQELEGSISELRNELRVAKERRATFPEASEVAAPIKLRHIVGTVAKYYEVPVIDMHSARRTADIVRPRQVAMYLCRQLTLRSLPEIGRHLGGRDHTTALHAVRKIENLRMKDARLCQELAELEVVLGSLIGEARK